MKRWSNRWSAGYGYIGDRPSRSPRDAPAFTRHALHVTVLGGTQVPRKRGVEMRFSAPECQVMIFLHLDNSICFIDFELLPT